MLIDLLAHNACSYVRDRIFALAGSGGARLGAGATPAVGSFQIRSCTAEEIDSHHVRIAVSGIGWKWISRTRNSLGAEFTLNKNVKFQVDMETTGTIDLVYDRLRHVATAYLIPTAPVDVTFDVTGDFDISSEGLWSSIVGTAASVIDKSPEARGRQSFREKGIRRFRSRLDNGATIIIDLCTGQRYTRFGSFPAGKIPQSATPLKGMIFQENSTAELHTNTIIMAGPYETNKPLVAYVEVKGNKPAVVQWYCSYNAEEIADAYVRNEPLPTPTPVDRQVARPGEPVVMKASPDLNCAVVLVMQGEEEDTSSVPLMYRVYYEKDELTPLVECE